MSNNAFLFFSYSHTLLALMLVFKRIFTYLGIRKCPLQETTIHIHIILKLLLVKVTTSKTKRGVCGCNITIQKCCLLAIGRERLQWIRQTMRNKNISRGYQQTSPQREAAKGQETSGKCSSSLVVKSMQNRTTKITLFLIRLARNKRTSKSGKLTGK